MNLYRSKLRFKLLTGVGVNTVAFITVLFLGWKLYDQQTNNQQVSQILLESTEALLNADRDLYQANEAFLLMLVQGVNDDNKADYTKNIRQAKEGMEFFANRYQAFGDFSATLTDFYRAHQNYHAVVEGYMKTSSAGVLTVSTPNFETLRDFYKVAGDKVEEEISAQEIENANSIAALLTTYIPIVVVLILISILLSIVIPNTLVRRIQQLTGRMNEINHGDGDLTIRIDASSQDELGVLGNSFNAFLDAMQSMIAEVKDMVEQVAVQASELDIKTDETSSRSLSQTQSLEQVATAVEEYSQTIHHVLSNTQMSKSESEKVTGSVQLINRQLNNSNELIATLSSTAKEIETSIMGVTSETEKITSVLDVIRGIADQTNLLALNAAIEAARAGEHGRGFAVVSDEVRSLASATQSATEEIQGMIEGLRVSVEESTTKSEQGVSYSEKTANSIEETKTSLEKIVELSKSMEEISTQIVTSTEQQSESSQLISEQIAHLNANNDDNLAANNGVKSVASEMKRLADVLKISVGRFRTN
ncbi:HAMP domain-containing protein [Marinomonas agarivorans]|nr:HAMP domain-containing protein [Marinomonas agarivorans]